MTPNIKYFCWVGGFDGAVLHRGRWVRVNELNRINKAGWERWQGPPSSYLERVLKCQRPVEATDLFPHLAIPGKMRKETVR